MKYLLLIPAVITAFFSAFCWISGLRFKWGSRWITLGWCVAGFLFQFTAIYFGSLIDRA